MNYETEQIIKFILNNEDLYWSTKEALQNNVDLRVALLPDVNEYIQNNGISFGEYYNINWNDVKNTFEFY